MKAGIIKFIRDNIDFKSGVFQTVDGETRLIADEKIFDSIRI